ncbi:MAG: hypothetical protein J6A28_03495 [Clostridia bacterium]|nr:hypothetical protein [Clostridia bacterium]
MYFSGRDYSNEHEAEVKLSEAKYAREIEEYGYLDPTPNYNETVKKAKEIDVFKFGNGLKAVAAHANADAYTIYKHEEQVAKTSISPLNSFHDSGYFLCDVEGGEKCRFMDGEGVFCFGVYGKRTGPFHNGYARIQKADGSYDFINKKGQELGFNLVNATNFVYQDGDQIIADVRFKGAKHHCFINPKGEIINQNGFNSQAYLDELGDAENDI